MAAPVYNRVFTQDITQKVETRHGGGLVFNGNNGSMTLGVRLYDGGEPLAPSGAVTGQVILADGQTALTDAGTIEGNLVSVTLNQSCFAVEGPIIASISVTDGGVKTTVLRAAFTVALTSSGPVIDPGQIVPDVGDIVAQYGKMQRVTAEAEAAAGTALSAASGISDTQVATFRAQGTATSGADPDGHTFTLDADGVSPTGGTNASGGDLCRKGYVGIGTPLLLTVDTSEYKWCVWIYTAKSVSSKIRSLTNNDYTTGPVVIPNTEGAKYFRVGFKRLDGATVTEEMRTALAAQMHIYALTDTALTTSGAAADAKATGDRLTALETEVATIDGDLIVQDNFNKRDRYQSIQRIANAQPTTTGPISALTVIDGKLFVFKYAEGNADTTGNKIYQINDDGTLSTTAIATFTSNLGHANTVDWNENKGYLVTTRVPQEGDATPEYRIYLLPGINGDTTAFDRTAAGVIGIDIDTSITLGGNTVFGPYRLNAVWGPNNLQKYDLLYVFSDDSSSQTSGTRRLALIQLGLGANVFTHGTAVSGAEANQFNGTFNVISTWSQPWELVNGIAQGNNDACYFGGKIYELPAPTSVSGFPLMIHSFDDFGATWKTERILIPNRSGAGATLLWEKEGIAIYNGHMYIGSHGAGLFVLDF